MRRLMTWALIAAGALAVGASADAPPTPREPSPRERLAEARKDVRISRLTLARIQRNLQDLLLQGDVDATVIEDYSIYLARVRAMLEMNERIVRELESIDDALADGLPMARWPEVDSEVYDPAITRPTTPLDQLDRELDAALTAFDEFLLKEQWEAARRMARVEEASSEQLTELAREAAAAVERLRDKGIDIDTRTPPEGGEGQQGQGSPGQQPPAGSGGGSGSAGDQGGGDPMEGNVPGQGGGEQPGSGGQTGSGQPGGEQGQPGDPGEGAGSQPGAQPGGEPGGTGGGAQTPGGTGGAGSGTTGGAPGSPTGGGTGEAAGSGSSAGGAGEPTGTASGGGGSDPTGDDGTPSGQPGDRPPAADDDIVARQLREAAEKETDPVLREKLWQEYDKYKASSS
ncbi:MAG: hypothetical protein ACYTJ0_07140 [Planctomycetota bacterium]|jgi:hypothetical protein